MLKELVEQAFPSLFLFFVFSLLSPYMQQNHCHKWRQNWVRKEKWHTSQTRVQLWCVNDGLPHRSINEQTNGKIQSICLYNNGDISNTSMMWKLCRSFPSTGLPRWSQLQLSLPDFSSNSPCFTKRNDVCSLFVHDAANSISKLPSLYSKLWGRERDPRAGDYDAWWSPINIYLIREFCRIFV